MSVLRKMAETFNITIEDINKITRVNNASGFGYFDSGDCQYHENLDIVADRG